MNSDKENVLNFYINDPDPRYAIAIDGEWGSGKTFFMDGWIESLKKASDAKPEDENTIILKPVSVSLYGKTNTSQVLSDIDRVLHPILNSKLVKAGTQVLNFIGKAVINSTIKVGDNELELSSPLSVLDIFSEGNSNIKGDKLFIFDDFERSNIDTKDLLGFINWFVERAHCHVVIIGDFSKLKSEANDVFNEFKEKTIGRTLQIIPDTKNALTNFLTEIPSNPWTTNQYNLILNCNEIAGGKNLRILRHLIRDFNGSIEEIELNFSSKQESFLKSFLATFIITGNLFQDASLKHMLKNYSKVYGNAISGSKDIDYDIVELQSKINPISQEIGFSVMDPESIGKIIEYFEGKCLLKEYIKQKLEDVEKEAPIFSQLDYFYVLEDNQFNLLYQKLEHFIISSQSVSPYELGLTIDFLCQFDHYEVRNLDKSLINMILNKAQKLIKECSSIENLYKIRLGLLSGSNKSLIPHGEKDNFNNKIEKQFSEMLISLPGKLQLLLRSLNDSNVELLKNIDDETAPDGQSTNNFQPIFQNESVEDILKSIDSLSNKGRYVFNNFLRSHYQLGINVVNYNGSKYAPDIQFLTDLKKEMDDKIKKTDLKLKRLSYEYLSSSLNDILEKIRPAEI